MQWAIPRYLWIYEAATLLIVADKYEYSVQTRDRPPRSGRTPAFATSRSEKA